MHYTIKKRQGRLVIYAKDVQYITGRSRAAANRIMRLVRKQLNKPARALVTIQEFCNCTGMPERVVMEGLE